MDDRDVEAWFAEYLEASAACGRGERDTASLREYYGVPLLLTTDDGAAPLMREADVLGAGERSPGTGATAARSAG